MKDKMDSKKIKKILKEFKPIFMSHMDREMEIANNYDMATIDWEENGIDGEFKLAFKRILAILIGLTEKEIKSN